MSSTLRSRRDIACLLSLYAVDLNGIEDESRRERSQTPVISGLSLALACRPATPAQVGETTALDRNYTTFACCVPTVGDPSLPDSGGCASTDHVMADPQV